MKMAFPASYCDLTIQGSSSTLRIKSVSERATCMDGAHSVMCRTPSAEREGCASLRPGRRSDESGCIFPHSDGSTAKTARC